MPRLVRTLARQVERCIAALLASPASDWPRVTVAALRELTGASGAAVLVAGDGSVESYGDDAATALLRRTLRLDAAGRPRFMRSLWRHHAGRTAERPEGCGVDAVGVGLLDDADGETTTVAVGAACVFDVPLGRHEATRRLQLLRAVRPALWAGAAAHRASLGDQPALAAVLDAVSHGALLCTPDGRPLLENAALAAMVAGADDPVALREELAAAGARLARMARAEQEACAPATAAVQELRAGGSVFALRGVLLDGGPGGGRSYALLTAERRRAPTPVTAQDLAARFGLTARECEVAELLRAGQSNADVAAALGISPFTARHHTERVLGKLGLRTRAAVHNVFMTLAAEQRTGVATATSASPAANGAGGQRGSGLPSSPAPPPRSRTTVSPVEPRS